MSDRPSDREIASATEVSRRLNVDMILSLCALLISAVACAASLYQLHIASSLISAQTWPYVTIGWSYANEQTGVAIDNDGLGPALVRDVVLTINGQPQHDTLSGLRKIVKGVDGTIHLDAIIRGAVIRASRSMNLFVVQGRSFVNQVRSAQAQINLELCYCSILGRCWKTSLVGNLPEAIARCPDEDPKALALPEPGTLSPSS